MTAGTSQASEVPEEAVVAVAVVVAVAAADLATVQADHHRICHQAGLVSIATACMQAPSHLEERSSHFGKARTDSPEMPRSKQRWPKKGNI
jgi:hypothetical protein